MARSNLYHIPPMSWGFTAVLVASVFLIGLLGNSYADFLSTDQVKTINLFGQRTMSPDRVQSITDAYLGKSLQEINLKNVQDAFLEYPLIRSAKATRHYPHTLDVYLYDILPVAYISTGSIMTLDDKATLLPLPDNGMLYNLPIITGIETDLKTAPVRELIPDETVQMLVSFLKILREEHQNIYLDISEVSYDRRGIKLISATNGTTIYLGNEDEALVNSAILSEFISSDSDSGIISTYQYIDLRFDQQVIVKERTTR